MLASVVPRDTVVTYKPPRGAKVNLSTADHVALADTGPFYPVKGDLVPEDDHSPTPPVKGHIKPSLVQNGSLACPYPCPPYSAVAELSHSYGSLSNLCYGSSNDSVAHIAHTALTRANTLRSGTGPLKLGPSTSLTPTPESSTSSIRTPHLASSTNSSSSDTNDSRPSSVHGTNTEEASFAIPIEEDDDQEDLDVRDLRAKVEERGARNTRLKAEERQGRVPHFDIEERRIRNPLLDVRDDRGREKPRLVLMKSNSLNFTPLVMAQQPPLGDKHWCSRTITPTNFNLQQRRSHLAPDHSRSVRGSYRSNKSVSFDRETRTETFETEMTESETDEREFVQLMSHYNNRRPVVRLPVTLDDEYVPPGKEEQDFLPKILCFVLALVLTGGILYGFNILISRMNMNLFSA